jgi:hypothetical protein
MEVDCSTAGFTNPECMSYTIVASGEQAQMCAEESTCLCSYHGPDTSAFLI